MLKQGFPLFPPLYRLRSSRKTFIDVPGNERHPPGTRVHETGIPFNDPSGGRLRDWMGASREMFYDPKQLAILPMGLCYPGRGKSGDLPPRQECANAWRQCFLDLLPNIRLSLIIGQYAHGWHFEKDRRKMVTNRVRAWRDCPDCAIPLPHPSPRNNIWLRKSPWFEDELVPVLKERAVRALAA